MKLILATQNNDKIKEIQQILKDNNWDLIPLNKLDSNLQIIEDGLTLEENAKKKAEVVMKKFGLITLGEDTGLEVEALQGQPGVYSARFAGEKATYQQNVKKLLKLLEGIKDRKARFRCICALAFPNKFNIPTKIFEGVCEGTITETPKGTAGFGYDPVFIPDGFDKTFAELSPEEKNKISHRAKALIKVKEFLNQMNIK
ncbi:MAG: RdgB/HAM1 family non-canonical purine NTP pyrophosphatase [candidate division WOR-3 bacterium]|nr:RdgB/HAM1 family non-canonical purine NTP pyrophosphatase [candidate division WOR-3 bacterium]